MDIGTMIEKDRHISYEKLYNNILDQNLSRNTKNNWVLERGDNLLFTYT